MIVFARTVRNGAAVDQMILLLQLANEIEASAT
jgi:hypothetical protein